jgi:hypothetical protein
LGAGAGLLAAYALTFVVAAIVTWRTGQPMFPNKKTNRDDT